MKAVLSPGTRAGHIDRDVESRLRKLAGASILLGILAPCFGPKLPLGTALPRSSTSDQSKTPCGTRSPLTPSPSPARGEGEEYQHPGRVHGEIAA
jgi:hypothetical protein